MSQKNIMLFLFVMVMFMFGVLIVYDLNVKHKLEKTFKKENWEWKDNWVGQKPNGEIPEDVKPKNEAPKGEISHDQITASNYDEAMKKSKELNMPILIMFEADWCSWCHKMKKETLQDEKVKSLVKNYIFLAVDADSDVNTTKKFAVYGLPCYAIVKNEQKVKMDSGYKNADSFAEWLSQ